MLIVMYIKIFFYCILAMNERSERGLYEVTMFMPLLGFAMGIMFSNFHMCVMMLFSVLQTTQPTSGGADSSCCANCVEHSRPQQWGPDLPFFWHAGHADPMDG